MPLERRATQTTATNSATYLVTSRRRVLTAGPSAGACCGASAPAAPGRVEERKCLMKSRPLIASTVSNLWPARPAGSRRRSSFDHLVGAREQHRWHIEPQRVGSLHIDHQFELGRRLHG